MQSCSSGYCQGDRDKGEKIINTVNETATNNNNNNNKKNKKKHPPKSSRSEIRHLGLNHNISPSLKETIVIHSDVHFYN